MYIIAAYKHNIGKTLHYKYGIHVNNASNVHIHGMFLYFMLFRMIEFLDCPGKARSKEDSEATNLTSKLGMAIMTDSYMHNCYCAC